MLNELHAHMQKRAVMYWRTKRGEEVDFVVHERGLEPIAIECKRSADDFDPKALLVFRSLHSGTKNYVVARFVDLDTLAREIVAESPVAPARSKRGRTPRRRA